MYVIWAVSKQSDEPKDFAVAWYAKRVDALSAAKGLIQQFPELDFDVFEDNAPLVEPGYDEVVKFVKKEANV